MKFETRVFNINSASHEEYKAFNSLVNLKRLESHPDDPSVPLETTLKEMKSLSHIESFEFSMWTVWYEKQMIAFLFTEVAFREDNKHLIEISLFVLSKFRRQGIGSSLLEPLLKKAKEHERTLILDASINRIPAGAAFAELIGAKAGYAAHTNQLKLSELDKNLMQSWINDAKNKASDFELGFLEGVIPEQNLDEILELMQVMNTAPLDDLELEDFKMTSQHWREHEALVAERGTQYWMYYVRHKASGELAGYTEMYTDSAHPELMNQDATGVLPKYRGHGLGKWLKASMIMKVLQDKPKMKFIRTGNADSNAPMLAINHAMGFKPYIAETVWQLKTEKLEQYLNSNE